MPGRPVRKAVMDCQVLMSEETLYELADVLSRKKFDRYLSLEDRQEFMRVMLRVAEMVPIVHRVQECRDDADNRILEVAVNGDADAIVSGDADLLSLNPFRGIHIMKPADFMK
jgi:putative PIN family toxin of toxin-antitoxin system